MFFVIISIILVIIGRNSYGTKLDTIAETAHKELAAAVLAQEQKAEEVRILEEERVQSEFDRLTSGLSDSIKQLVERGYFYDEEIHIVAFGSRLITDSQNEGITPWPDLLEQQLNEAYEKSMFQVSTVSVGGLTSLQVLGDRRYEEVLSLSPDIVIIEPFVWNNIGEVATHDTHIVLSMIMEAYEEADENFTIYVQPPHPVFGTHFYPLYVEQLKDYALENGYNYIDHWSDWPDVESDDLLLYVNQEHQMPTQEGHERWSSSIMKLFVNP